MRKALVTIAIGSHFDLLKLSRPALELFSARHCYELIIETELRDPTRPASWSKILAIQAALENHDIVFWIDSDAIILRTDIDVVSVLNEDTHFAWVNHGDGMGHNAGILVLRRAAPVFSFLSEVYEQYDLIDHTWWEQAAIMRLFALRHHSIPSPRSCPPNDLNVQVLGVEWNAIREVPCTAPIIRHFPGETMIVRFVSMAEIILSKSSENVYDTELIALKTQACEVVRCAQADIISLQKQIDTLLFEKQLLKSSLSWKITAPFRWSVSRTRRAVARGLRLCIAVNKRLGTCLKFRPDYPS
jgi:hypothetical protein